ncbi:MAG: BTAD domain-containing putative transcriptional regulator, partial [Gemmatimonadota bacterium]
MFELRLLGEVDLRAADGRRVDSILSQPKRLALLAVLALSEGGRLQRDELIGLFWPELPESRARRALSQALHYLRRSLGPNVVDGKYETGIGLSGVRCDACRVLEAARSGRPAEALAEYSGELMPGFHVDGAPVELERWLSERRVEVRSAAAESAWSVAEEAAEAGDVIRASKVAWRAHGLSPWGEPSLHRLMTMLVEVGDRAGALRAYDDFVEELQTEYGGEPSVTTRMLAESARERPAAVDAAAGSAAAPVAPSPGQDGVRAAAGSAVEAAAVPEPETWLAWHRTRLRPRSAVGTAITLLVVLFPALWLSVAWGSERERVEAGPETERATLYLEPVRDLEFPDPSPGIAGAITDEVAANLADVQGFRVVTGASPVQSPHGLRLRSTLRRDGDRLHLTMLLVDPASEAVLDRIAVESEEPLGIETPNRLAEQLSTALRRQVGEHLYMSRLAARGVDGSVLSLFRLATAEAAAADSLRRSGSREAAEAAYRSADSLFIRAEGAAPGWPEPGIRRAKLALQAMWMHMYPPYDDPAKAQRVVQRGLSVADVVVAMAPEDPGALEIRGILRYWDGVLAGPGDARRDRFAQSQEDLGASVKADPGRAWAWSMLSDLAERRGDFAEAYNTARRAYAVDRDLGANANILARLFNSALEIGDLDGAARWCAEAHARMPDHWLGTYCDLSRLAWAGPWSASRADSILDAARSTVPDGAMGEHVLLRMK